MTANKKHRVFGQELQAILIDQNSASLDSGNPLTGDAGTIETHNLRYLDISLLHPGNTQPRKIFDDNAIQELAASIKKQGVLQPLIVKKINDIYEIIVGERRWRAAKLAGLTKIPVVIRNVSTETAAVIGLIENLQRQDLNPIEEALGYKKLTDEFKMTHAQIAASVGKSRTAVTNILRLNSLEPFVHDALYNNELEMGHARALLGLTGAEQIAAAKIVINKKLSVRRTEELVKAKLSSEQPSKLHIISQYDAQAKNWQQRLIERLKSRVQIKVNAEGQGRAVIFFDTPDEIEWLVAQVEKH